MSEIKNFRPTDRNGSIWDEPKSAIREAIIHIASELGGEELVEDVTAKFSREALLPDYDALQRLEILHPGTYDQVKDRVNKINQEALAQDGVESAIHSYIKFGNLARRVFNL